MPTSGRPALSLNKLSENIPLRRQALSEQVADEVLTLFKISLKSTFSLIGVLCLVDTAFVAFHVITPADRLVNDKVLMALIGSTVVQVGAAAAAIVSGLFRKDSPEEETPE